MLNIGDEVKLNNLLKNILKSEIYEYNEFIVKSTKDGYFIIIQTVYDEYDFTIKLLFNRFFKDDSVDFSEIELYDEEDIINLFDHYTEEDEFEIVEINKY